MIRICDLILSGIAFIILLPFFMVISIILKFTGEGYVFYKQNRVGLNGKEFGLLKFATMLKDSPSMKNAYITTTNDPRVLPFGKFLRKSKINELPQLLNILKGDISIVGPRPQVKDHLNMYPDVDREHILSIKPGLTGIASIFFRDEEVLISKSELSPKEFYFQYIIPYKVKLELWYIDKASFNTYFKLIFLTALVIVKSNSKYYEKILKDLPEVPIALR